MDSDETELAESPASVALRGLLVLLGVGALALLVWIWTRPREDPGVTPREEWSALVGSEEMILALAPQLHDLAFAVKNLELPGPGARSMFSALGVSVSDLSFATTTDSTPDLGSVGGQVRTARPAPSREVARESLALWQEVLETTAFFHHAKFDVVTGRFLAEDLYEAEVAFSGLATTRAGSVASFETLQRVSWTRSAGAADVAAQAADAAEGWEITSWQSVAGRRTEVASLLFRDVLDHVVRDPAQLARARTSIHERLASEVLLEQRAKPHRHFFLPALDRHPGVAVVDLDGDGFDDVYVMARWGANQLFHNQGDGTFREIAAEVGLDLEDHSSSGIFADFDNDGDPDLFLGRTLERSAYLVNEGGRFVDRSERVAGELPYLASSVSAVDYDRDGLLDIYVATYGARTVAPVLRRVVRRYRAGRYDPEHPAPWFRYLGDLDMSRIIGLQASPDSDPVLNSAGPPNVLLHNSGDGRFARVLDGTPLELYRNTYQASWADYDRDGDADVYLANDFGPDSLVRNDGGGRFTDVSDQVAGAALGLAMGATWGDYDRDGRQDLYVTNMYSKAGRRVTSSLSTIDPRYAEIAAGNYLYRNTADGFERVSGDGPGDLDVEHAGWGWGSLFGDVDNDGYLDLYALSGYYTAPPSAQAAVDT